MTSINSVKKITNSLFLVRKTKKLKNLKNGEKSALKPPFIHTAVIIFSFYLFICYSFLSYCIGLTVSN